MTKISAETQLATAVPTEVLLALADTTPVTNENGMTSLRKLLELSFGGFDDLGTQGAAYGVDWDLGEYPNKKVSLSSDITLTFSNGAIGMRYCLSIKTNGFAVTFPTNLEFFGDVPTFPGTAVYQPVFFILQG